MQKASINQIEWVLRIAVSLTFIGHGYLALDGNDKWLGYLHTVGFSGEHATQLIQGIGMLDMIVALGILIKPHRYLVLWAFIWTLATALIRPISGESIWEFVERSANWGITLALLLILNYKRKNI